MDILFPRVIATAIDLFSSVISPNLLLDSALDNAIDTVIRRIISPESAARLQDEESIQARANQATEHLISAGRIIDDLQSALGTQREELQTLIKEIEARKTTAQQLSAEEASKRRLLDAIDADMKELLISEFKDEAGDALREELDRGKTRRIILAWAGNLFWAIIGGFIGFFIQNLGTTGKLF